jgi:predicted nucleotidyltransferase
LPKDEEVRVMITTKENIIKFLKENKELLTKQFFVKRIALFGSYARDEVTENSDIDLLIDTEVKDIKNRFYLKEYLSQNLNSEVDICYLDSLRSFIKKHIQDELIYV